MPWACCRGVLHGVETLFVADSGNHCIRAVSTEGAVGVVKTVFGRPETPGKGPLELNFPWSLCYHGNLLYIGDKYNQRIVVLSPDEPSVVRVVSDDWPWGSRFAPRGFASSPDGLLYMSSSVGGMIWRYEPPGSMDVLFCDKSTEDGAEVKTVAPARVAGAGIRAYRDGRAEFAEFMYPAGIAVDRDGSLLVADHGNHVVRRVRKLREAEVKAKLRKMLQDMNNRGIRVCFQRWCSNVGTHEPLEPLEVVTLLALGTLSSGVASQDSPLVAFHSPALPPSANNTPALDAGTHEATQPYAASP
jgi:DNA-binding beta-propeller fold protein YncE